MLKIASLIIMISLSGCTRTIYIRPVLPLPDKLVTNKLAKSNFQCLNKSVRDNMAEVLSKRKARLKRLRKIISDHNKRAK